MKSFKVLGVIIAAFFVTALAIDASDTLTGKGGTLLAQLSGVENSVCEDGMVQVKSALTFSCVDKYEAAVGSLCLILSPKNEFDTNMNLSKASCKYIVSSDKEPWRQVNREQAAILCARSDKRLPTAAEWYQFSLGTPVEQCNTNSADATGGTVYDECISAVGVVNSVGNVWEWVTDDVIDGVYKGRSLPQTGYVMQVDSDGVATLTDDDYSKTKGTGDYFWTNATGTYGMIRGGFYGSRQDAGVFTIHAQTVPTFSGTGIGFRCVR